MALWLNRVTINAARNGTTSFTINPASTGTVVSGAAFTPTAGRLLVCLFAAGVTATTPLGWTLPTNGSAVNNTGLYVWHRVAAGGDTITTTAGSSNFPAAFDIYEFPAGSSFLAAASAINVARSGGAGPTLTLSAGTKLIMGAVCQGVWSGTATTTWSAGVEAVDTTVAEVTADDGYTYSLTYLEDSTLTSSSIAATLSAANPSTVERLMFAVTVAANTTTGTMSATVPKVTASLPGTVTDSTTGTMSASVPLLTASMGGTAVTPGTMSATVPKVTASVTGGSVISGSIAASVPVLTSNTSGTVTVTGSIAATVPKVTANLPATLSLTVAQENALTSNVFGRGSWYDYGNDDIQGFARSTYYTPGQTAQFSVDYNSAYTCEIYRLGWYGDTGSLGNARRVASFAGTTASQPAATTIPNSNGAVTCAAWSTNVSWAIPSDATPGWYWLLMKNSGSTQSGGILFCVSDANQKRNILVVASEATWGGAYSGYGGNNVYGNTLAVGDINNRALCVSYDKPVLTRTNVPQTHFFNSELPLLRFFERFGFNVGYTTIEQINNDPTIMDGRAMVVFSGHNEYIPQRVRNKTAEVISAGTNVANFAANDFFWRVAFGGNTFPTGSTSTSTGRVMWCKKDTMAGPTGSGHTAGTAFTNQADWTGTWQDTRWTLREPSNLLLGDRFIANGFRNDEVKVPFAMKSSPIWRNVAPVQALTSGQTHAFGVGSCGFEWDMPDGPMLSVSLSASVIDLTNFTADVNGETYTNNSTQTHAFQMVRNGSGRIFNANTTQWAWTVENLHLRGSSIASAAARQATLNVLYDLGAVGDSSSITAASLTVPTPVSSFDTDYNLPAAITGTMSATVPKVSASVSGASLTTGTMSVQVPTVSASLPGVVIAPTTGSLDATVPDVTTSISGVITGPTTGSLSGSVPVVTTSITGQSFAPTTGILSATLPVVTSSSAGASFTLGTLNASVPVVTSSLPGVTVTAGSVSVSVPRVRARIDTAVRAVVPRRLSAKLRASRYRGTIRP